MKDNLINSKQAQSDSAAQSTPARQTRSTIETDMTRQERDSLYAIFWDDKAMNALIRDAVHNPDSKRELDKIIYVWACESAASYVWNFKESAHAGVEEGDIANEMFASYASLDLEYVAQREDPKQYLCRAVVNHRQRFYSENKTLLNVTGHTAGTLRSEYLKMLKGDKEKLRKDKLTPSQLKTAERLAVNNAIPVQLYSVIQNKTADGPGAGVQRSIIDCLIDPASTEPLSNMIDRTVAMDFVKRFFPDPMMRLIFLYIYLNRSLSGLPRKVRVETAYQLINEEYGVDRPEFDLCESDMRRYINSRKVQIRQYLAAAHTAG